MFARPEKNRFVPENTTPLVARKDRRNQNQNPEKTVLSKNVVLYH